MRSQTIGLFGLLLAAIISIWTPLSYARADVTYPVNVSVASDGTPANLPTKDPAISANGPFVAFESGASNLVPNDTNGTLDVFRHDVLTGSTTLVSVSMSGVSGNGSSEAEFGQSLGTAPEGPAIRADGRYIVFDSFASDLVPNDTNNRQDVFVRDMKNGVTTRLDVASDGTECASPHPSNNSISANGRYVAFFTYCAVVRDDTNNFGDIYVHDMLTGSTTRISVSNDGTQSNGVSEYPAISADGKYVMFASTATNLTSDSVTAGTKRMYLRDLATGINTLLGTTTGNMENSISTDGRYAVYNHFDSQGLHVARYDRLTGITEPVDFLPDGSGLSSSIVGSISGDGRYVSFGFGVGFVRDMDSQISMPMDGDLLYVRSLSLDGRYITFQSTSTSRVFIDRNAFITDSNDTTVFDSLWDQTVNEGQTLQFTVSADDADGDVLTYSASNLPPGATFDPNTQSFSWTPDYTQREHIGMLNSLQQIMAHRLRLLQSQ